MKEDLNMSSDEEVICVRKKKVVVADSSDENEAVDKNYVKLEDKGSDHEGSGGVSENGKKYKKKQRRIKTFDSSSESDHDNNLYTDSTNQKNQNTKTCKKSKTKERNSFSKEKHDSANSQGESSDTSEEPISGEIEKHTESITVVGMDSRYNNTDLYDAEGSSEEEDRGRGENKDRSVSEDNVSDDESTLLDTKRKQKKNLSKGEERKSKKKAKEDIKTDIHRESQRLMRQVPISIPYHRPKQRSLAEFLVRRKTTPNVSIQTSSEQLVNALREIEQREKEAELFYKSDSSEDESEIKNNENKPEKCSEDEGKFSDVRLNESSQVLQNSEQSLSNFKETDSAIHTGSEEGNNERCEEVLEDLNSTEKPGSEECNKEKYSQKSDITDEQSLPTGENIEETSKIEQEKLVSDQTEIVNTNSLKELKILDDELGNTKTAIEPETMDNIIDNLSTCKGESCESLKTTLENKIEILENIDPSVNTNPTQPVKQSQSEVDDKISLESDINKTTLSNSMSCSLINTEEFSLKLSESQSEFESTEIRSFQSSSDGSKRENSTENPTDSNTVNESSSFHKLNQPEDDKTDDINQQRDQIVVESKNPEKIEQSWGERDVEDELYKKYNIDLKTTAISVPTITGSHDELIDLSEGTKKTEVHQLMKRFLTHLSYKKKPSKKKMSVELSIVSAERDGAGQVSGICEESVQVMVGEEEEEEDPQLARPGAKMARLRAQLQQQMERQRDQEWAKRMQEQRLYEDEEVFEGEKDVCDGNEDEKEEVGDCKNEDETEEEEEEEDEEESENEDDETDEEVSEKKRKSRSVFLDDEAEESDEEPYTLRNYKNNDDNNDDDDCNEATVDTDSNDKEINVEKAVEVKVKSPVKGGDKKGSQDICAFFIKRPSKMKPVLPRTKTASDMFSSQEISKYSTDEEEMPSFQKPRSLDDKEDFEDEMPSFQNPRSLDDKEDVEEKLSEPPSIISPAFQLTALENTDGTTKYNWSEPSTPCKDFLSPKIITPVRAIPNLVDKSPQVCTQDLENMCSGRFDSQPLQEPEENDQDFELFLADDSQLTDHVTPVKSSSSTGISNSDGKGQMKEFRIDDDDELSAKVPSKKAKKLNFSDDEDDGDDSQDAEAGMERSDEEGSEDEGVDNGLVEYDSEENEVEVAKTTTGGEFLDVEAELSEEEWSSEDEDERGLDALEMEEADKEKIDQRKLKRQLDQIHMKEMLKEDKKQVKLLQEMLLEDGELHSENKRQRLFRWSNNTAFDEGDNKAVLDSDEEKAEDDEDEENWRKSRHERELFLQEHSKKVEKLESLELEESDSQLMRLGQKALKRLSSNSQEPRLTPPSLPNPLASPDGKKPFTLPKRGSFLSRGQQALSRLAQMVSSTSDGPIQQPKNSRNFVFTSISPTKGEQEEVKPALVPNKRKMPHLPLPIAKKPCIPKAKTANKKSLFEALTRVHR